MLGTAKDQTEIANEKEIIEISATQSMGKSKHGKIQETDLKKYLNQNAGDDKTVVKQSNTNFVVTFIDSNRKYLIDSNGKVSIISREGLKVGDYVNYAPDVTNTTYSVLKRYTEYSDQTILQENLDWQILRIYDDGSIDLIGSPTTSKLGIRGDRYSNAVYLINDICKKLYSNNSKNIEARNIKIEDIEYWLSDTGKEIKNSSYGETITYTGTFYYPDIYQYEIGSNVNSEILEENKIGRSESYVGYNGFTTNNYNNITANEMTINRTFYNLNIDNTNFKDEVYNVLYTLNEYWVASRGINTYNNPHIYFNIYKAGTQIRTAIYFMGGSGIGADGASISLRPIVNLGADINIERCNGSNNAENPHIIK